eukprot:CAMPEP_0197029362 /NCGR_PEP_ID=MMETSP1384-20130603/8820_1 /TAXON_ID=29189 /ORGANISM="Ammonia sp." /LENGTH=149 /DNA_ID=CAMNT_0042458505 /DNA_START=355 /DNA_END=801 /DNA_ORIENTATION=-
MASSASNASSSGSSSASDANTKSKSTPIRVSSSIAHSPPIYEDEAMNSSADDEKEANKINKTRDLQRQRAKSAETVSTSRKKKSRKLSIGDRVRHSLSSLQKKANTKLFAALQENLKIKRLVKKLLILTITAVSSTLLLGCSVGWISIW